MRHPCDGRGLLEGFRAAVVHLESYVDEINELNVYPVPDGDTGSNMLATVKAALEEADGVAEPTLDRVAHAIGFGALMGARGNSGVITSQIVRGMADGMAGKRRFNGRDLAEAMTAGTRTAYGAVVKPVEGTILTVMREASEAAVRAAEASDDVASVLRAVVVAAEAALEDSPSLLPILREAGVVDAGGAGLARLFEGALLHLAGTMPVPPWRLERARTSALIAHADEGFGYETMFLLQPRPGETLDVDEIRVAIEALGESVVLAGDSRAVKVHVHSERPNEILEYGLTHGTLSRISIENLDAEAHEVLERRAHEFTSARPTLQPSGPDRDGHGPDAPVGVGLAEGAAEPAPLAVIAVAAGEGLAAVFRSFGVTRLVAGGQSANPSTGDLVAAIEETDAVRVVLLPNNANILLAAHQAAGLNGDRVTVVPTRNAAEGLAAMLALDPSASADENVGAMAQAARAIQSLQVTRAVRDARIGGRAVTKGQTIVLDPDDGLVSAETDETLAVIAGVDSLSPGYELLTLYYGADVDLPRAEALGRRIEEHLPEVEVEIVRGDQPHYLYLVAAE